MNKTNLILSLLAAAVILTGSTSAVAGEINSNTGTSAFPFLKINIGSRAVSMGGAFTGLANDESALYYNPAGIASFEQERFIAGYHNYFDDIQSGFLGYIKPVNQEKIFLGFHISYLNYGEFFETDSVGNLLGNFSGSDLVLAGSIAFKKGYSWKFGATTKIIYEKIHDFSAAGLAFDLGAKYSSDREYINAGLAVQNLGFQISGLGNETSKLPLTVRGGGSIKLRRLPLLLAADLILPVDNDLSFAFGGDYSGLKPFYIRAGWNTFGSNHRAAKSEDSWAGMALGFGFDLKESLNIAYAFTPGAELGDNHRITLTGGL